MEFAAHQDSAMSIAIDHTGALLASGSKDRTVAVWNLLVHTPLDIIIYLIDCSTGPFVADARCMCRGGV